MTQQRPFASLLAVLLATLVGLVQGQTIAVAQNLGQDLRFGTMVVAAGGTLVLNPQTGALSGTASVFRPPSFASSFGAAEFVVTCTSSRYPLWYTLTITSPGTDTLIATDDLSTFTAYSSLGALGNPRRVDNCTGYTETVKVGATLTLGNSPAATVHTAAHSITLQATLEDIGP